MKKIKKKITSISKPKILPHENKLEPQFQSIISSLHKVDLLTLNPKFDIVKGHIAPKGTCSILITIFSTLLIISSHIFKMFLDYGNTQIILTWHLYYNVVFHIIYHFILGSLFIVRRKKFASFILTLNKIFKFLNTNKYIKSTIWPFIVAFILQYILYLGYIFLCLALNGREFNLLVDMTKVSYFMNFFFAVFTMKLLSLILEKWNESMEECGRHEHVEDGLVEQLFQCYVSLIEAYKTYQTLMQEMILMHIVDLTINNLLNLGVMISAYRIFNLYDFILNSIVVLSVRVTRDMCMLLTLIYYSERSYMGIESVQNTCRLNVSTLDRESGGYLRKVCKNVDRMCQYEFHKIHLCGLFPLDVTLPLGIIALLSTYVVVVLQFSVLYLIDKNKNVYN